MHNASARHPFHQWVNLAQPRLGAAVVYASDDFFAPKERLIQPSEPVFIPDRYDDHGKWMDGWESRRKRTPGHDFCIVRLGLPGVLHGLEIDTRFFTGNYPPFASVEACCDAREIPPADAQWTVLCPRAALDGDARAWWPVDSPAQFTHVRLNIFPDGGVARLRVYGEVRPDWQQRPANQSVDLFALENGGRALLCNDEHFGSMHNLNAPGRGLNMGDGWETARRRVPGNDWAILALGAPGIIERVEIDTAHFKGNYPDRASLQAVLLRGADADKLEAQSEAWDTLLPEVKLQADAVQCWQNEICSHVPVSHVRLNIFPDGGVSRLRLFGKPHVSQ